MHPILQLDRQGWTYQDSPRGFAMKHACGATFECTLDPNAKTWMVVDTTHRMVGPFQTLPRNPVLHCPAPYVPEDSNPWDRFWAHVEASVGVTAQARFQQVYDFIGTLIILSGHTGVISRHRSRGHCWTDQHGQECSLGEYEDRAQAYMNGVTRIAVPGRFRRVQGSDHWTHVGFCCWDGTTSQHKRLAVIRHVQEHGLILPGFA